METQDEAQATKTGGAAVAPDPSPEDIRSEREERAEADDARNLIRRAAGPKGDGKGSNLTADEEMSALEWFLSDAPVAVEHTLQINIGTPWEPRWIGWTIQAVDVEVLRRIRKEAEGGGGNRRARRLRGANEAAEVDPQEQSARIVLAGTVNPDLREIAKIKLADAGVADAHVDPDVPALQLLRHRFRHKPGLIDQLAGEVMGLSGYDDEDIREHAAGKA